VFVVLRADVPEAPRFPYTIVPACDGSDAIMAATAMNAPAARVTMERDMKKSFLLFRYATRQARTTVACRQWVGTG
jgi:hypothetical protein